MDKLKAVRKTRALTHDQEDFREILKKHTAEFIHDALKLADQVDAIETAENLGIFPSLMHSWRTAINNKRTQSERESIIVTDNALLKRKISGQAEMLKYSKTPLPNS